VKKSSPPSADPSAGRVHGVSDAGPFLGEDISVRLPVDPHVLRQVGESQQEVVDAVDDRDFLDALDALGGLYQRDDEDVAVRVVPVPRPAVHGPSCPFYRRGPLAALIAQQSGQRLAEERKQHGLTQAQLAETMGVTPGRVSQIERGELSTIEAIARYVQALGGHLELVANFADHTLTVTTTEAA
jgi:DNA-binding XRE family transcriptional regulator